MAYSNARHWTLVIIIFCLVYWILKTAKNDDENAQTPYHLPSAFRVQQADLQRSFDQVNNYLTSSKSLKEFPKFIWQTSDLAGAKKWENQTATWKTNNPDWKYTLLDDDTSTDFVHDAFSHRPGIVHFWDKLELVILRADLIRYLAMLAKGGVYSDMDTSNLTPIDEWIPNHLKSNSINAVIGIEYDDTTYPLFVRNISFCQWTLMAKPGHAIFETIVQRVISNLEFSARLQRVDLPDLVLGKKEVLAGTGPGLITDVVMQIIREQGEQITWETFHDHKEPRLYGDILILPINAFAGNQKHSKAGTPEYGPRYVAHHFGRSWYKHNSTPPEN